MSCFCCYVLESTYLPDRCFVAGRLKFLNFWKYLMLNSLPGISKNTSTAKKMFSCKISENEQLFVNWKYLSSFYRVADWRPKLVCIKSGWDITDKHYGPVIQPLLGGGPENRTPSNGWKSSLVSQLPAFFCSNISLYIINISAHVSQLPVFFSHATLLYPFSTRFYFFNNYI